MDAESRIHQCGVGDAARGPPLRESRYRESRVQSDVGITLVQWCQQVQDAFRREPTIVSPNRGVKLATYAGTFQAILRGLNSGFRAADF